MSASGRRGLQIVGRIHNFVTKAGAGPLEQLQKEGLVLVAMDSRAFPHWGGDVMSDQWVLRRVAHRRLPELQPWPATDWRFWNEEEARAAYSIVRQHIFDRLPGVEVLEDKSEDREIVDPQAAWSEAFHWQGREVVFLACDRSNDVLATTLATGGIAQFQNADGPQTRNASMLTQTGGMYLATATTGGSNFAEHVTIVFAPGDETDVIMSGIPGASCDDRYEPFEIDVPSGLLVIAWGRVAGAPLFAEAHGHDAAAVINGFLGASRARPVPTALDPRSAGPLAWALRVAPGEYTCAHYYYEELGMQIAVLSLRSAPALFDR